MRFFILDCRGSANARCGILKLSMHNKKNWHVITGGPSSGKTTIIKALEEKGYRVVHEAARQYIDEQLARGLTIKEMRRDELQFQREVLKRKMELEASLPTNEIIFFDRGIPDSVAYYEMHGFNIYEDEKFAHVIKKCIYGKVFLLKMLAFKKDYARVETAATAYKIHRLLKKAYDELSFEVVTVPVGTVEERIDFIFKTNGLSHLHP